MSLNRVAVIYKTFGEQKKSNDLQNLFSQLASRYNLILSSQVFFNGHFLGVDGPHRKLLLLKPLNRGQYGWHLINLNDVKSCSVRKTYKSINAGAMFQKRIEEYLEKIVLYFEFANNKAIIEIPFYLCDVNSKEEALEKEQKAKNWQLIFSKLIKQKVVL